jgi:hypothetical protein
MAYLKTLPRHFYKVTKKAMKNEAVRFLGLLELGTP